MPLFWQSTLVVAKLNQAQCGDTRLETHRNGRSYYSLSGDFTILHSLYASELAVKDMDNNCDTDLMSHCLLYLYKRDDMKTH